MEQANHDVTHAADGISGMQVALRQSFDVMIFDRQLPGGVDGANLLRDLRGAHILTPALILSGHGWLVRLDEGPGERRRRLYRQAVQLADLLDRVEALHRKHASAT